MAHHRHPISRVREQRNRRARNCPVSRGAEKRARKSRPVPLVGKLRARERERFAQGSSGTTPADPTPRLAAWPLPTGGGPRSGPAPGARGRVPGSPGGRFLPASLGGRPAHLAAPKRRRGEAAQTRWSQAPARAPRPPGEPRCGRGGGGGGAFLPARPFLTHPRAGCVRLPRPGLESRRESQRWESRRGSEHPSPVSTPCETPDEETEDQRRERTALITQLARMWLQVPLSLSHQHQAGQVSLHRGPPLQPVWELPTRSSSLAQAAG
ncbi:translation initiation factor IF-2-like isoform X2 [Panthera leo]|uniref:translation initiation factor IF-2-like isoform X2 n=1 Tax=Panthera leo TaxID=9689 RepID=UPI001C695401|nr:translation initiation factor IF-2-like isoform X2 [Panthera leo]